MPRNPRPGDPDAEAIDTIVRPRPPDELSSIGANIGPPTFRPAPELLAWVTTTLLTEGGALFNAEHRHLSAASVGFLWTNVINFRNERRVLGQTEFRPPGGVMGKWSRARAESQLLGWFGRSLDFLVTIDARYAAEATDEQFIALIEHELFHCGQAKDEFGAPRFSQMTGAPVFALRSHDVEEFTGVIARYGVVTKEMRAFAEAIQDKPILSAGAIAGCCGTCAR